MVNEAYFEGSRDGKRVSALMDASTANIDLRSIGFKSLPLVSSTVILCDSIQALLWECLVW